MIIQVRGTSGSGKTWAMKQVMEQSGPWKPQYVEGRKRPLYYMNPRNDILLGHYEIACGGCDTIGSVPDNFKVIQPLPPHRFLLCEGLLMSEDVKWTVAHTHIESSRVLFLVTSVDACLENVKQRQSGKEPADPERVIRKLSKRIETIERARVRLIDAGVDCRRTTAAQAPGIILKWLNK